MRILHRATNELIAEGERGWAITSFEGNFYISRKALRTKGFKANFLPGLCVYKFLYVWLDFHDKEGNVHRNLGWKYWLPNPIFPFIWFRVAIPQQHPDFVVTEEGAPASS